VALLLPISGRRIALLQWFDVEPAAMDSSLVNLRSVLDKMTGYKQNFGKEREGFFGG